MQSPPGGGSHNGNGPPAGWPPPPAYPPTQAQPAWPGQPAQPASPPTQLQPAFTPPPPNNFPPVHQLSPVAPWPPASPGGSPFRPSPNDPYASYGQVNAQPVAPRSVGPGDPKILKNPRRTGLFLLGVGILLGGINYWSLTSNGRYYIKAMFLAPFALTYGLWLLAVGQPVDPATGKPRIWWRIGSGISLAAGLGLGGLALSYVGC